VSGYHQAVLTSFAMARLVAAILIAASSLIMAPGRADAMTASQKTGLPCAACHAANPRHARRSGALIELTPLYQARYKLTHAHWRVPIDRIRSGSSMRKRQAL
jgi:hypothetical protein